MPCGQRGRSPTVVGLSFLDRTKKEMRKENVLSKEIVRSIRIHVEIRRVSAQSAVMYKHGNKGETVMVSMKQQQ
jgi:hypothetical protein